MQQPLSFKPCDLIRNALFFWAFDQRLIKTIKRLYKSSNRSPFHSDLFEQCLALNVKCGASYYLLLGNPCMVFTDEFSAISSKFEVMQTCHTSFSFQRPIHWFEVALLDKALILNRSQPCPKLDAVNHIDFRLSNSKPSSGESRPQSDRKRVGNGFS